MKVLLNLTSYSKNTSHRAQNYSKTTAKQFKQNNIYLPDTLAHLGIPQPDRAVS